MNQRLNRLTEPDPVHDGSPAMPVAFVPRRSKRRGPPLNSRSLPEFPNARLNP